MNRLAVVSHMTELLNYSIKPIDPADDTLLWEMLYHAIYVPEGSPPPPRQIVNSPELARYVRDWGRPHDTGFLAIDEQTERPVGAAWLRLMTKDDAGYGFVDEGTPELSIALLPEYRGRGIGTRLLAALLEEAGMRYEAVSLSVSGENPAVRMYQRAGFEVISSGGGSLTMKRFLNK